MAPARNRRGARIIPRACAFAQAREHHIRLDLLWFGTWKNGSQHYMPEWMKADPARYFHLIDKNGRPAVSLGVY